jgi:hypothetical protein
MRDVYRGDMAIQAQKERAMKFTKSTVNQTFTISAEPEWPCVVFETDASGAHT